MYIYILSPLVTAIIAGVGYIGKRYVDAIEDRRKRETDERDKRREEIEGRITQTELRLSRAEKQVKQIVTAVMTCEHPDCETKDKVLDLWVEDGKDK